MQRGNPVFCTRCNSNYCEHLRANRATLLTPREVDLLRAACNPKLAGYKEISAALGLSPMTVKIYLSRVYNKIGLAPGSGRITLAVLWAMAHHEQLGIELPRPEDFMWHDAPRPRWSEPLDAYLYARTKPRTER